MPQIEVHPPLLDGNPLRALLGQQHVGSDIEIDPARIEVQSQPQRAGPIVDERIAARKPEPAHGLEVDRSGQVVQRRIVVLVNLVQRSETDAPVPQPVFGAEIHRVMEHPRRALFVDLLELQLAQIEIDVGNPRRIDLRTVEGQPPAYGARASNWPCSTR